MRPLSDAFAAACIASVTGAAEVQERNPRSYGSLRMGRRYFGSKAGADFGLEPEELAEWRSIRSRGFTWQEAADIVIRSRRAVR